MLGLARRVAKSVACGRYLNFKLAGFFDGKKKKKIAYGGAGCGSGGGLFGGLEVAMPPLRLLSW